MNKKDLAQCIQQHLGDRLQSVTVKDMVTVELVPQHLVRLCRLLRDEEPFKFDQLVDACAVDYSDYGISHWRSEETTQSGFSRAVKMDEKLRVIPWDNPRYGVVYHLLSVKHNHRIRLKTYLTEECMCPSLIDIWSSVNWYEREAFDLFGIEFDGHPDLRRLLTDYGFKGHPFRKDFPLIGEVEMRYDAKEKRCVYEPVSIQPRVLVPKVIRDDSRYAHIKDEEGAVHGRNS